MMEKVSALRDSRIICKLQTHSHEVHIQLQWQHSSAIHLNQYLLTCDEMANLCNDWKGKENVYQTEMEIKDNRTKLHNLCAQIALLHWYNTSQHVTHAYHNKHKTLFLNHRITLLNTQIHTWRTHNSQSYPIWPIQYLNISITTAKNVLHPQTAECRTAIRCRS